MKLGGGRGQGIYEAQKIRMRGFDSFNKRGSALYEADKRGEQYSEPKSGVPYYVCLISIDRSLTLT